MTPEERAEARRLVDEANLWSDTSVEWADFASQAKRLVPKLLDALEAAERERDEHGSAYVMAHGLLATEQVRSAEAIKERDTARAHVETLTEALQFYADRDNWTYPYSNDMEPGDICEKGALVDLGDRARAALKAAGLEDNKA